MKPTHISEFAVDLLQSSNPLMHSLLVLSAAVILCLPCLLTGIPPGFDAITHVSYQYHFNQQFLNGELYPRWLVHANKGFGSPTFFIQYPFPYFTTAILRLIPWSSPSANVEARQLGIFCFLAIAAAGLAARFWFRTNFGPFASSLAAIVYMSLPYVLSCLYARTAIGELSTLIWMPLIFAMCDRIAPGTIGLLGLFAALLILSNPLIACLCFPASVLYTLGAGTLSPKPAASRIAMLFAGLVLGAGISAVYSLPFLVYRHLFDPSQMQARLAGFELGRYFVFLTSGSIAGPKLGLFTLACALVFTIVVAWHIWRFPGSLTIRISLAFVLFLGLLIAIPDLGSNAILASGLRVSGFETPSGLSLGMVVTTLFTIGLGFLSYCRVGQKKREWRIVALLVVASSSFLFMLPWSASFWHWIPALGVVQFPFRLGTLLSVAVVGLVAAAIDDCLSTRGAIDRRPARRVVALAIGATLGVGFLAWRMDVNFRHPRTALLDPTTYVDINYRMYVPPDKIRTFAQMLGTSPGSYAVASTPVQEEVQVHFVKGQGTATVERNGFREFTVSADSQGEGLLQISQLYFPLWRVSPILSKGGSIGLEGSPEGLMEVPVSTGKQKLRVELIHNWPERYGIIITVASLIAAAVLTCFFRTGRAAADTSRNHSNP